MKIAFTIATSNYLAQAKSVSDSFLRHNADYIFIIVLLDKINTIDVNYFKPANMIEVEDIQLPSFSEMVIRYNIFELSNALKPFIADFLFTNDAYRAETVLYFDSDIFVYHSLKEVDVLLESYDILLSPHLLSPLPIDGLHLKENAFLNTGIYNGGFFALKQTNNTLAFIAWWKNHMATECLVDLSKGLFVDQIWLNLVPLFFEKVYLIKNMAYNVAYWNLHERTITVKNETYLVNNEPLIFFHFSGYDINQPETISKYQDRYSFNNRKDIIPLFEEYKQTVLNNNYLYFSTIESYYKQVRQETKQEEQEIKLSTYSDNNFFYKSWNWLKRTIKYRL